MIDSVEIFITIFTLSLCVSSFVCCWVTKVIILIDYAVHPRILVLFSIERKSLVHIVPDSSQPLEAVGEYRDVSFATALSFLNNFNV